MERTPYEKRLRSNFFEENHLSKKPAKKVLVKKASGAKPSPAVITVAGKPMVKTGTVKASSPVVKNAVPTAKPVAPANTAVKGAVVNQAIKTVQTPSASPAKKQKAKKVIKTVLKPIAKVAKGTGKGVKKAAQAVAKATKKVAVAAKLAPLVPLKGVMARALKKKGHPVPPKLEDLAESFHNNIVRKSSSFDGSFGSNEIRLDGFNDEHLVGDIVDSIIAFIKDVRAKRKAKKAGRAVQLSAVEESIAAETEGVLGEIERRAKDAGISTQPDLPGTNSKDAPERDPGIGREMPERAPLAEATGDSNVKTASMLPGNIPTPVLLGAGALLLVALLKR